MLEKCTVVFHKVCEPLTWQRDGPTSTNLCCCIGGGGASAKLKSVQPGQNSCKISDTTASSQFRFSPSRLFITCRATQEVMFPAMWVGLDIYALLFVPCFRFNHDVQIISPSNCMQFTVAQQHSVVLDSVLKFNTSDGKASICSNPKNVYT